MSPRPEGAGPQHQVFPAQSRRVVVATLVATAMVASLRAIDAGGQPDGRSLGDLSIEELMNESVTSVSRKEQRLFDVATAISVLSNDDLRRSGSTTLPDALRFVPGMDVGAVNAREWSVSARGFDGLFSNKLLVLVDGRAVYSPIFAGVFWDLQQSMLADVDRIEVIRGPGATVWGANAVNGVINVVSRSARDTQGGLLYGEWGDIGESAAGARYGGRIGAKTYFRVFASAQENGDRRLAGGASAQDGWEGRHGGFRLDHYSEPDSTLTWQMDATSTEFEQGASESYNVNTLGRWTRAQSDGSRIEVQAYYDRTFNDQISRARHVADTLDLAAQRNFRLGSRHNVVSGIGYRFIRNRTDQVTPLLAVRNGDFDQQLFSAFVQDEVTLAPERLTLTVGAKLEHNNFTGLEFQPSVRAVLKLARSQTVWAALSRAVRTPSSFESNDVFAVTAGAPFVGPDGGLYLPTITGNADPSSEVLWASELGYRIQPSPRINVDLAAFHNDFDDLIAIGGVARFIPGVPFGVAEMPFVNTRGARTYGIEAQITVAPTDTWLLIAAYSAISVKYRGALAVDQSGALLPPQQQFSIRSAHDLSSRTSVDVQARFVDRTESVPAYVTADLRLAYRVNDEVELSLMGQNLLEREHAEQGATPNSVTSEVPRSVRARLTWRF